jgi:hypothetical protein
MPRHLTKRQQNYLDSLIKSGVCDVDDLTSEQFQKLESMNDYETLYQNATMYIWDRKMEGACDGTLRARYTL